MCPACHSEAFYRYGRTRQGKQRFRCLICGRQFTTDRKRTEIHDRPSCPVCESGMHAYKREHDGIRFRCSAYPQCRTFLKVKTRRGHELLCP
jgi:transposase-like protein